MPPVTPATRGGEEPYKKVPVVYQGLDELPIMFSNIFLIQFGAKSEFILSFGQLAPPLILPGTEEERRAQADKIQFVSASMLSRFALTEDRFRELLKIMTDHLKLYDEHKQRGGLSGAE